MPRSKFITLFALATLSVAAIAQTQSTVSARPGTLNYTEGQTSIEGRALTSGAETGKTLAAGESLSSTTGKAEILLTPGIFLRVGSNSTVNMVTPNLTQTEVRLEQGKAIVEVDEIYNQNRILIDLPNGQVQLLKKGLYAFDASSSTVSVFDGKANVYPGSDLQSDIKPVELKGGRRLALNGDNIQSVKFDKDQAKDDLYNWGSLRSQYLGEANLQLASEYAGNSGFNPGWYWAGGIGYTWLPGNGLWWNPYGYGFYSPYYLYGGGPIYGGYYRPGFYGYRGGYRGAGAVGTARPGMVGGYRGGMSGGGGFRGGAMAGGGARGGGGGGRR